MKRQAYYVKYLPEGDTTFRAPRPDEWKSCSYGIEPEYANASRTIEGCHALWESTGNRLYVIEAFRAAASARLYPPEWVLEELNARFTDALTRDIPLDRAFGFSGEGLGSGRRLDAKTKDRLLWRNYLLCMAVLKLEGAGLSRSPACDALARALSKNGILVGGNSRYALARMKITGKGIVKAMNEYADAHPDVYAELRATTIDAARSWTTAERRELLRPFFPGGIPIVITDEN